MQNGFILKQKSKWFNAVSGYASESLINQISQNSFVRLIDIVGTFAKRVDDIEFEHSEYINDNPDQPTGIYSLNYGSSFTPVSYTHLRAHETVLDLVCRLLLEKKKNINTQSDLLYSHKKISYITNM